jgi:hypothetical protein
MSDVVWRIELAFTEEEEQTRADAVLRLPTERFHTHGRARRAPGDPSVPVIGEELAAARALSELAHELIQAAATRIGAFEGRPVRLPR